MLKKIVTYEDFDGNQRTEELYFNYSKAELMEMQMGEVGGLEQKLRKIISSLDGSEMMKTFKELLLGAYGEKSPDGKRFIKNQELRDAFEQTEAYSQLFMEIVLDAEKMAEFFKGVIPSDLAAQVDEELAKNGGNITNIIE